MSTREREPEQSVPLKYAPERALAPAPEPSPGSDRPGSESRSGGAHAPERRPRRCHELPNRPRHGKWPSQRAASKATWRSGSFAGARRWRLTCRRPSGCTMMEGGRSPATTRPPMGSRIRSPRPTAPASMPQARPLAASGRWFCGLHPCARPLSTPTRRPRNVPTPLNRPLLFATAPSPRRDRCGGQSDPGAQLVSKGRGPWFEGRAAATQPVRPIGALTHVGMVCAGPGGAG
jgi:hypothetical protein